MLALPRQRLGFPFTIKPMCGSEGDASEPAPCSKNRDRPPGIMFRAQGGSGARTAGTKILLEAMSKDQVHLARFVLDALDGRIVDSKTEGEQTPLVSSALLPDGRTRCKFLELLLQRGADVNGRDGAGRTALTHACEKGHLDAVKILVRNNADPEIPDSWGNTALMYAAVAGHSPVVEFLVRAFKRLGLQVDRQNKVGNSAAEVATLLGHTECISALTNRSRKGREAEEGAPGPGLGVGGGTVNDKLERNVGLSGNRLQHLQTLDCQAVPHGAWPSRPRMKPSLTSSMGSIEEHDVENGRSSEPPELVFSGVLTPKPPPRTSTHHSPTSKHPRSFSDDHLPPLTQSHEAKHPPLFFSPQPTRNAPEPRAPSALDILLTPILGKKSETDTGTGKPKTPDIGARRFLAHSYYQKRWSLPSRVLSPAPPERTLLPLRQSRAARRRGAEPGRFTSTNTFTVLSNKLLRRFTSPELEEDAGGSEGDSASTSARMPRSETFPQGVKHPQVGSKASVDSISAVKCEFDFQLRTQSS